MIYLNIAHRICVSLEGPKSLFAPFHSMLQEEKAGAVVGRVKAVDTIEKPASAYLLHDGKLYADGHTFYVKDGATFIKCEPHEEDFDIEVTAQTDSLTLADLLQALLNYYMPAHGLIFLHTASYLTVNQGVAIHAFGGTGKTEVMLHALRHHNADFISDDLAIFNTEGQIFPYPRPIALHGYPFTDEDLEFYGLNVRTYKRMMWAKQRSGRFCNYLYQRYRGRFHIKFDYTKITGRETPMKFYDIDKHIWMETGEKTEKFAISSEDFARKMSFCMANEFRAYIDYDGWFGAVLPFWAEKRKLHDEALNQVVSHMQIQGMKIQGTHYGDAFEKITEL